MTAPTPGPWIVGRIPAETKDEMIAYVINCIEVSPDESHFYVVGTQDWSADICHVGNGPTSAVNARLIAAAPDLLTYSRRFFAAHDGTAGLTPEEVAAWREVVRGVTETP